MTIPNNPIHLTPAQHAAMIRCRCLASIGETMGRHKPLSMLALENAGLVERVTKHGAIVDWTLTDAGKAWLP